MRQGCNHFIDLSWFQLLQTQISVNLPNITDCSDRRVVFLIDKIKFVLALSCRGKRLCGKYSFNSKLCDLSPYIARLISESSFQNNFVEFLKFREGATFPIVRNLQPNLRFLEGVGH